MSKTPAPDVRPGWVSKRYVPPPGAKPEWYGETFAWVPAHEVTVELADGATYSGTWIGPEPTPDETGELAMEFMVPGKLSYHRVPLSDVTAFTVYTPEPPPPEAHGLAVVREFFVVLFWALPRGLWAALTGRGVRAPPPPSRAVTDENPVYHLVKAIVLLERGDPDLVDAIHRSVDAAVRQLPGLSDLDYTLPPDTPDDTFVAYVLLRAPNGPDRDATVTDALDTVVDALRPTEALPGIVLIESGIEDL